MKRRCGMLRRKHFLPSFLSLLILCLLLLICLKTGSEHMSLLARVHGVPTFHRYNVSCSAVYGMDPVEVGRTLIIRRTQVVEDTDESLVNLLSDCLLFTKVRGYDEACVTEEERDFPLAFSLVVHKSAWMVERLIKSLYSPSNTFCIHYDRKSSAHFVAAMEGLARCLPNVFISSKLESVYYASFSRLKADLHCLSDLLAPGIRWRYIINLCGQDFPLRSKMELVSELKKLHGANMLETSRPSAAKRLRFQFRYELRDASFEYGKLPVRTELAKAPPPHGIEMFSGNAYFVLSREFVEFANSSDVVKDFLAWSEDTYSPDEHFWATLVRLPGIPGEVSHSQADITDLMSKTRLVKWHYLEGKLYPACTGAHVRSVCIYGAAEMRWLLKSGHWFANKFDPKVDPVIIQCLEEKLEGIQRAYQSASESCSSGRGAGARL